MSATKYRLKTSGGVLSAMSLAIVHLTTLVSSQNSWRGDLLWGLQQLGSGLYVVLPVLIALCSVPSVLSGGVLAEEAMLPVRPTGSQLRRWAVDVAPVAVCHLAFVGWTLVVTLSNDSPLSLSAAVTLAIQLLVISFAAVLGRAIADVVRHPAAVVVAGISEPFCWSTARGSSASRQATLRTPVWASTWGSM